MRIRLARDGFVLLATRFVSATASLLLFGLLGQRLEGLALEQCYRTGFCLGFLITASRMYFHLLCRMDDEPTRHGRLRRAIASYGWMTGALIGAVATTMALIGWSIGEWGTAAAAAPVVMLASLDGDLVRASCGRTMSVPVLFAVGSITATAVVMLLPAMDSHVGSMAFVVQWLPVAVFNAMILFRISDRTRRRGQAATRGGLPLGSSASLAAASLFDGIVLNIPFLLPSRLPPSEMIALSLAVRIYSSSTLALPLMLHWANQGLFNSFEEAYRIKRHHAFTLGLLFSGIMIGLGLWSLLTVLGSAGMSLRILLLFSMYLFSFSVYIPMARFSETGNATIAGRPLAFIAVAYVVISYLLLHVASTSAIALAAVQASAFLSAAVLLARNHMGSRPAHGAAPEHANEESTGPLLEK